MPKTRFYNTTNHHKSYFKTALLLSGACLHTFVRAFLALLLNPSATQGAEEMGKNELGEKIFSFCAILYLYDMFAFRKKIFMKCGAYFCSNCTYVHILVCIRFSIKLHNGTR